MASEQLSHTGSPPRYVQVAVYRAGRVYRAVRFDLGLIVERPSAKAALDELLSVMSSYVGQAREAGLSWEEMRRPVPLLSGDMSFSSSYGRT
ncbi:MAG: hypothetical protein U0531_01860 [Dehalococcoidia bacterium]